MLTSHPLVIPVTRRILYFFLGACLLYLILLIYGYVHNFRYEYDFFIAWSVLPVCAIMFLIMLINYQLLWYLIVLAVPFSVDLEGLPASMGLYFPTEIILLLLSGTVAFSEFTRRNVSITFLRHPLFRIIMIYFIWILFTTFTSQDILVSLKFAFIRFIYLAVFSCFSFRILQNPASVRLFFFLLGISLGIVMIYTLAKHYGEGFTLEYSYKAARPFFKDHSVYAACIGLVLPGFFSLAFDRINVPGFLMRIAFFGIFILSAAATVASYTRAAWLGVFGAILFVILMFLRVRWRYILTGLILALIMAVLVLPGYYREGGYYKLTKNRIQLEGYQRDIKKHFSSATNIATDVSNLERINRWVAAVRIILDYPITGSGGGTFQYVYGAYQISSFKTIITTYKGTHGNCHNEYLSAMAETGVPGGLLFILLILGVYKICFDANRLTKHRSYRNLLYLSGAGLTTYFIHGFFNNFLQSDKCSVPFWFLISLIIVTDTKIREDLKKEKEMN